MDEPIEGQTHRQTDIQREIFKIWMSHNSKFPD